MFKKILIANRGEIACRVIKTARKMGIATVAVYSEADADALHVRMADEKVLLGPPPSNQSYLLGEKIIQACKDTGADAVHPGYGFLSENAGFCDALDAAGIAFIGPKKRAIEAMGDKIESKKLAMDAKVNTVPGHTEAVSDPDEAARIAEGIGYPVMLKASAGGGGKGMRIAWNDEECRDGLVRTMSEAKSSFGDDRVFVEKFITEPRHIEIQVLGDSHGNCVYLWERECSIQRRHQKVLEEAPSPFLDPETRKAMGEQAVALAKAVDYQSAGTVEFIVDADKNFYFLEMNTRLQVEHPVTELITGLDLVEQMILVAAGEKLSFGQDEIKMEGWALEARVYAEDPFRNFLPSTGRLTRYQPPSETDSVRVDTGVYEGGEISMFYDPMVAKLITYGKDRNAAIAEMREALDRFYIQGISQNISFLAALLQHPRFVEGRLSTNFIAEEYPDGFDASLVPHAEPELLIAVAADIHHRYSKRAAKITGQMDGQKPVVGPDWVVKLGTEYHSVHIEEHDDGHRVTADGKTYDIVSDWIFGMGRFEGTINGNAVTMQVQRNRMTYSLLHRGYQAELAVMHPRAAELLSKMPEKQPPDMSKFLMSPMPGLLLSVDVEAGQDVKAGEVLCVLEAMKMENVMRAERDGVVSAIKAKAGDALMVDQIIMEFE
ncbi:MAG: acetyl-CoA carboxylase biotin carboxylase subunit [Magnetovibrionaceae bacterium]